MSRPLVVVITGASSGIGRALAKNLAAKPDAATGAPFKLVLVARREEELKTTQADCDKLGGAGTAKYFVADVTKKAEVDAAADFAVKEFGHVDVWVNNAGRALGKKTLELTETDLHEQMAVNTYSAVWGSQAAARIFKAQGPSHPGQIINISSLLGRNAVMFPEGAAYNAAKHALNALTDNIRQALQADEATKTATVTLFSPGLVDTEFGINSGTGDHKGNPHAQPVVEVGEGIRECIEKKHEEYYSRKIYKKMIDDFLTSKAPHQRE